MRFTNKHKLYGVIALAVVLIAVGYTQAGTAAAAAPVTENYKCGSCKA